MSSRSGPARLPARTAAALNGRHLDERPYLVFPLVTSDADGWPRIAQLSVGEVLAVSSTRLYLALWPNSTTTRNLSRSGEAVLLVVREDTAEQVHLRARRIDDIEPAGGGRLAGFAADVVGVRADVVGYARITNGIEFELADADRTVPRWRATISELRRAARRAAEAAPESAPS